MDARTPSASTLLLIVGPRSMDRPVHTPWSSRNSIIWGGKPTSCTPTKCHSRRGKPHSDSLHCRLSQVSGLVKKCLPQDPCWADPQNRLSSGFSPVAHALGCIVDLESWLFKLSCQCFTAQEGDSKGITLFHLTQVSKGPSLLPPS